MMLLRPEGLFPSRRRKRELHAEEDAELRRARATRWGRHPNERRVRRPRQASRRSSRPGATRPTRTLLRADRVTKRFGGLVAVRDVDLDIPEGAIVSIIGPNGAGKTTFFNIIAGHHRPDRRDRRRSRAGR